MKPDFSSRSGHTIVFTGVMICLLLAASDSFADTTAFELVQTLLNPDPVAQSGYETFGSAMVARGSEVLVGNASESRVLNKAGEVYLIDAECGELLQSFTAPTPRIEDHFGKSVAFAGETVLVGSPYDDTAAPNAGVVYIFHARSGSHLRTLLNPFPDNYGCYGYSADCLDGNALIGSPFARVSGIEAGEAYLYDVQTGALLKTFRNPNITADGDRFGFALAVALGKALVGAPHYNLAVGAAYLFDTDTGDVLLSLANPTPENGGQFGYSVAFIGEDILIGCPFSVVDGVVVGEVHLFDGQTGALLQTYRDPDPEDRDTFGHSVSPFGEQVLIGASSIALETGGGYGPGKAYLFDARTGVLLASFGAPNPSLGDRFGFRVASDDESLYISALADDTGGPDAGAVFRFLKVAVPEPEPSTHETILWVCSGDYTVKRYDGENGSYLDDFATVDGNHRPTDLTFGPDGNLYVSVTDTDEVLRYDGQTGDPMGAFVEAGSGGLDGPVGLRFGPDGNLYVASMWTHQVKRYDGQTGSYLGDFAAGGGLARPGWLFFWVDGLYAASTLTDSIKRYDDSTGEFTGDFITSGRGGLDAPMGFVFQYGYLYVVSGETNQVKRYQGTTGAYIDDFVSACNGGLKSPVDLQFAGDSLYVTSSATDNIKCYHRETGDFIGTFVTSGSGGLKMPRGVRIRVVTEEEPGTGGTVPGLPAIRLVIIMVIALVAALLPIIIIWSRKARGRRS